MSLEDFFVEDETPVWGSEVEKEIRLRIKLSIAAYAYEFDSNSIMTDHDFDHMCLKVNKSLDTGNKKLDKYFRDFFDASTGQWIHMHPELNRIKQLYEIYYKK